MYEKNEDKFLILLDEILAMISEWKENYVPPVEKDDVPETLDFQQGEFIHFVDTDGSIDGEYYSPNQHYGLELTRRLFKSAEMAEMFAEKTQFIADCLFFKELYDRDFVPDWSCDFVEKYSVLCNSSTGKYCAYRSGLLYSTESVYFSTEEIAQKCADWLNRKREKE